MTLIRTIGRIIFYLFIYLTSLSRELHASPGDSDPIYKLCVGQCEETGFIGSKRFPQCQAPSSGDSLGHWHVEEPLHLQWKLWDCRSDCRYHCMKNREEERKNMGTNPVKYHGKWPFERVYGIQEPISVAFSVLNLAIHFHGWISFLILVYYNLPLRLNKKTYYEYTGLWHIYASLAMNAWLWSSVFHCRDVELTERLDYSSAVALLGFSLILSILRAFNVVDEAARVMVAAPILSFVATHILFLNIYDFDYGLNMKVCVGMGIVQMAVWAVWGLVTRHPARVKLLVVVIGGGAALLLEIFDFPPYFGYVDAHALWHVSTVPLSYLWWSFVRNDAEFITSLHLNKSK